MKSALISNSSGNAARDALLDAARKVFEECGFDRARMATIAERAGISASHIYNFFRSKSQLFLEVHYNAITADIQTCTPALLTFAGRQERLTAIARFIRGTAKHNGHLTRLPLALCERALRDPELRDDLLDVGLAVHEQVRRLLLEADLLRGEDHRRQRVVVATMAALMSQLPLSALFEPDIQEIESLAHVIGLLLSESQQPI